MVTLKRPRTQRMMDAMVQRFEEWDADLTSVRAAGRELSIAHANLRRQVDVARRHGHSWSAIGMVLDLSEEAARQRFGRPGEAG